MKRLLLIWTILLPLCALAQEGYSGRDFWVTSLKYIGLNRLDSVPLYLVGDSLCTGYVENPNTSFYETFSVVPGVPTIIKIPQSEIQYDQNQPSIQAKGVHISAFRNIYAYLQNFVIDSIDNFNNTSYHFHSKKIPLFPVQMLTDNLTCLYRGASAGFYIVVAIEDGTLLTYDHQSPNGSVVVCDSFFSEKTWL